MKIYPAKKSSNIGDRQTS